MPISFGCSFRQWRPRVRPCQFILVCLRKRKVRNLFITCVSGLLITLFLISPQTLTYRYSEIRPSKNREHSTLSQVAPPKRSPFQSVADQRGNQIEEQIVAPKETDESSRIVHDIGWVNIPNKRHKLLIYSAYYEESLSWGRIVRIIGVTKTKNPTQIYCQLHFNEAKSPSKWTAAKPKLIRENWGLKYTACFIICPVSFIDGNGSIPVSVSITVKPPQDQSLRVEDTSSRRLQVSVLPKDTDMKYGLEICVKPLYNKYNHASRFIEFLELYTILGATHFTFYNSSMGPQVECIAKSYIEKSLVAVYPWKLDVTSQKEIRTEGIFASLNDCLYRTRVAKTRFAAMVDVDEFLMPGKEYPDLTALLRSVERLRPEAGSVSFQNGFHYLFWPNDSRAANLDFPDLLTLTHTKRLKNLHRHRVRSKYIVDTTRVQEVGNHFVWEYTSRKFRAVNLTPQQGISHHYRVCEFGGTDCVKLPSLVDDTAYRFAKNLVQRVRTTYEEFREHCQLEPILK